MKLRILFERWALREGFDVAGSGGKNGFVKTSYYDDALNSAWQRVVTEAAVANLAVFDNKDEEWFPIATCPVGVTVCLRSQTDPVVRPGYVELGANDTRRVFSLPSRPSNSSWVSENYEADMFWKPLL